MISRHGGGQHTRRAGLRDFGNEGPEKTLFAGFSSVYSSILRLRCLLSQAKRSLSLAVSGRACSGHTKGTKQLLAVPLGLSLLIPVPALSAGHDEELTTLASAVFRVVAARPMGDASADGLPLFVPDEARVQIRPSAQVILPEPAQGEPDSAYRTGGVTPTQ